MNTPDQDKRLQRLRIFWLSFAMFLVIFAFVLLPLQQQQSARTDRLVQQPVMTPALTQVYEEARDSSLRIEIQRSVMNIFGVKSYSTLGIGSGFFINADGLVLTAYHVVDHVGNSDNGAHRIVGVTAAEERYTLKLIGFDAYADLALLKADLAGREPTHLPLSYTEPKVGSEIIAIGNSNGEFLAPRSGRVMKLDVQARRADFASGTIELSARLDQGDSGGPVINEKGEVIGVVSYISFIPDDVLERNRNNLPPLLNNFLERSIASAYASYAVPVSVSNDVVNEILAGGKRDVPVIGIYGDDYNPRNYPNLRATLGELSGAWVLGVADDSPAEAAGLERCRVFEGERLLQSTCSSRLAAAGYRMESDVITHVDGKRIRNFQTMIAAVRDHAIGETVTLTVRRNGSEKIITLTLGAKADIF